MKRTIPFAIFAFIAVACEKQAIDNTSVNPSEENAFFFTAGIEKNVDTKATINGSYQSLWASGDQIGIHVYNNDDTWFTIAPANLTAGVGEVLGTFTAPLWDASDNKNTYSTSENKWNVAAVFPYNCGQGIVTAGDVTFNLPAEYTGYTSGKSLLPLLADMSSSGDDHPTELAFSHVGAGIKVTINGIPAIANSIMLTVDGQKITGAFPSVKNNKAGDPSTPAKLTATASVGDDQSVKLTFGKDNAGNYDFIFPVPEITDPSLYFKLLDDHNLVLWSAKAENKPSLERAQVMTFTNDLTIDGSKIAANVMKKNNFFLTGWYVDGTATDYKGDNYGFASGSLTYTATNDAWVTIKDGNGNYYSVDASLNLTNYVEVDNTTLSGINNLGIILNNKGDGGNNDAQTGDKNLDVSGGKSDYVIQVASDTFTDVTSTYSSYVFPTHSDKTRIYVIDNSGFGGTHYLYMYNGSSALVEAWPGRLLSTGSDAYPRTAKLTYKGSTYPYDKFFIPNGATNPSLSYNVADGSLQLSF